MIHSRPSRLVLPALGAALLILAGCSDNGKREQGTYLYQGQGTALAPNLKAIEAVSYNAVTGDSYYPQPGEFFFFKEVGLMVGNNGFRASHEGGAFWVTFAHEYFGPDSEAYNSLFTEQPTGHSEVVGIPPGQTRTYVTKSAKIEITTPADIAHHDEISVLVTHSDAAEASLATTE